MCDVNTRDIVLKIKYATDGILNKKKTKIYK